MTWKVEAVKVIVGLGNPGKKYVGTRHNIGFEALIAFAGRFGETNWKTKFDAETAEVLAGTERVFLAAPQTYMNLSGRSVRKIVDFFQVDLSDLLLVHDDMNLETGRLRIRASGSAGGQKGLQNTIDQLGSNEFARLRIGIGRPPQGISGANFVLQRFAKSEIPDMEECLARSVSAMETWALQGADAAMNAFNQSSQKDE
ncbi:aminoacyl-tRNA hydrolase [Thalassoglobus sp. JC818]|uniref:aminoacyl-tRNA hydrolase n=1 Tax=Thalassoglobus sp. JC818 TaxID=3232136 RepID=UPI00345974E0